MLVEYLLEKLKRKKLNSIERAKAIKRLVEELGLTSRQISQKIKKSPAYISNTLRLLNLPEAIQDGLISGLISEGHARALAAIEDTREMINAYKKILQEEGSVRLAEKLARQLKTSSSQLPPKKDFLEKAKEEISAVLENAKVEISRSRVQSRLTITLKGGYEKTESLLKEIHRLLTKPTLDKGQ